MKNLARITELEAELKDETTFLSSAKERALEDALWDMTHAFVIGFDQSPEARKRAARKAALVLKGGRR